MSDTDRTETDNPAAGEASRQVEAFVHQYSRYQRHLHHYILTLMPNIAEADDVLQETSMVLWRKYSTFQPGTSFFAWARRIAYFQVLKARERVRRGPAGLGREVLEVLAEDPSLTVDEMDDRFAAVKSCMDKLADEDRHLIRQRYLQDIAGVELAASLGRPVNSVYKSLGRVRRALQLCVQRYLARQEHAGGDA